MKKINFYLLLLLGSFAIAACSNNKSGGSGQDSVSQDSSSMSNDTTTATSNANPTDTASSDATKFALKAAEGGMMEVQLGQIAEKNAASQRVKNFGAMMVKDHSKANDELKSLAAKKNITLPLSLSSDKQKDVDNMSKMTGNDFDSKYMSMMTDDHKEDVSDFKNAAQDLKDPDLKSFASMTLPVLQIHLDSAQAIKAAVK